MRPFGSEMRVAGLGAPDRITAFAYSPLGHLTWITDAHGASPLPATVPTAIPLSVMNI